MTAIEGLDKIGEFISTTEDFPLEQPDQPQQSLGQIAFTSINPKADYQTLPHKAKLEHEEAVLYLIQKWHNQIVLPISQHQEYHFGAHLYINLHTDNSLKEEERKEYEDWETESHGVKASYERAANKVCKAILIRAMTLQQEPINGEYPPQSLYPTPASREQPNPPPRSLGEIAYTTRFETDDFPQKSRSKWERAAQYLLYTWHQRKAKVISHYKEYTWGTHLYIGIFSSRDNGYDIWTGEPVEIRESYNIAASHVIETLLRHTIDLQQKRVDGQPSDESLFTVQK